MARPKSKKELQIASEEMFIKLWNLIDSMTEEEQKMTFQFEDRDQNVKDVLIHLYEWHTLLLKWITSNTKGEKKPFLPDGYNWKTYPEMNVKFKEKHKDTTLETSKNLLKDSHSFVMKSIETFTDEELFTKKYFDWTGTTSLGSYCVSSTSSHYDWAINKIKKHIKSL